MGAVLAASSFLFGLPKWAGAAYLIAVGAVGLWRAPCRCGGDSPAPDFAPRSLFGQSGGRHLPPQDDPVLRRLRAAVRRSAPGLLATSGDIGGNVHAGADQFLLCLGCLQRGRALAFVPRASLGAAGGCRSADLCRNGDGGDPPIDTGATASALVNTSRLWQNVPGRCKKLVRCRNKFTSACVCASGTKNNAASWRSFAMGE